MEHKIKLYANFQVNEIEIFNKLTQNLEDQITYF